MVKKVSILAGSLMLLIGFASPSLALDIAKPEATPATASPDDALDALVDAWIEFFDLDGADREIIDETLRHVLEAHDADDPTETPLFDRSTIEIAELTLRAGTPELIENLVEATREARATTAIATALKLEELGIEDDGTPLNELLDDNGVELDDFLDAVDDLIDRFQESRPQPNTDSGACEAECGRPVPTIPPTCEDLSTETLDACIDDAVDALPDGALDDLGECDPWNPETWSICVETQLPGGFDALPADCDLSNLAVAIGCIEQLEPGGAQPAEPAPSTTVLPTTTTTTPEPTETPEAP